MKPKLLYLVHRIPYPPNKGDKIRSFNWLKGLSESYQIYLGAFVDDEDDWQYLEKLDDFCSESFVERIHPKKAKLKSLKGLLSGSALTLPYYENSSMRKWVSDIIAREKIDLILVFSSSMAQFVEAPEYANVKRVIDFVDMDSDKWMQYAKKKKWPMSWLYRRESKKLLQYEKRIANKFDKSLFVSEKESDLFKTFVDKDISKIDYVYNGVDLHFFNPSISFENSFDDSPVIVFTGAMDYWANVEAVLWFAKAVFPKLKEQIKDIKFYIVGSKPTSDVLSLQVDPGIVVTGYVHDVRPYIANANLIVAPLRIARGIQNKVLEAMAMGKTVVVSSQGLEGINATEKEVFEVNEPEEWIETIHQSINDMHITKGLNARLYVESNFGWESNVNRLQSLLEE